MMVLAIPVAFLIRTGLARGFLPYELPLLAVALVVLMSFMFLGQPVGLAATLIVGGLILRRAGRWWRHAEPAPVVAASAGARAGSVSV
jgi:arabinofuranan 3-O-arabinosyltransferase